MKSLRTPLVAALVLVLALAGTAGAATLITGKQVKNNSLTGKDIKNGSVKAADISAAARSSLKGAKGNTGAAGANGADGAKGDIGATGPAGPPVGFMGRADDLSTDNLHSEFGLVNAVGLAFDNASLRTTLTPAVELRATRLVAKVNAAPGAGSSRYFVLHVNGDDTALRCTIGPAQSVCSGDGPTVIPPSSEVSMRMASGVAAPSAADAIYAVTLERP